MFTAYLYGIGFVLVLGWKIAGDRRWPTERALIGISVAAAATRWSVLMLTMATLIVVGRISSQAGLVVYPITNGLVIRAAVVWGDLAT